MEKLERSLQMHFAALTAIGGLLMATGEVGWMLPSVAVLAAVGSHLLVDRWRWFALPAYAAYLGMGAVAALCMIDFVWWKADDQLIAVARLLVWVEVVLLFQRKSVRVFEQIGVFCLLEVIVAAVFNSALLFGLMLVPFSVVGLRALVLLQSLATAEASADRDDGQIHTTAPESSRRMVRWGLGLPRCGVAVLIPPVLMLGGVVFYGLPRTSGPGYGSRVGGQVTTGFSDSLTLDQVGVLHDNPELVMRVTLHDLLRNGSYRAHGPIYLRGKTLEEYDVESGTGIWAAKKLPRRWHERALPQRYTPPAGSPLPAADDVLVQIDLQPLTSGALFAIAPYHAAESESQLIHQPDQWILTRRDDIPELLLSQKRFAYRFGTHAFQHRIQTRVLQQTQPINHSLQQAMLRFDAPHMPRLAAEADRIAQAQGDGEVSPLVVAEAIEQYLSASGTFSYTKQLTQARNRQIDPIEQFVAEHRRGHCQYFASAMVMMLRSRGIPARVVVGYRTDEYNSLGGHYIVRQSHAHTWVEALIDEHYLPASTLLAGPPAHGPVLVRFDPTPHADPAAPAPPGHLSHFYDFAQALWNSYVLDIDSGPAQQTAAGQTAAVGSPYGKMFSQWQLGASQINRDHLRAGIPDPETQFSWRAALLGVLGSLSLLGIYQIGLPRILRWGSLGTTTRHDSAGNSSVDFYQRLCELLAAHEIRRRQGETPQEFIAAAERSWPPSAPRAQQSMAHIVDQFYRLRYGGQELPTRSECERIERSLNRVAASLTLTEE